MPKIRWSGLPPALRDHLFERLRERKITVRLAQPSLTWRPARHLPRGPCFNPRRPGEQTRRRVFGHRDHAATT